MRRRWNLRAVLALIAVLILALGAATTQVMTSRGDANDPSDSAPDPESSPVTAPTPEPDVPSPTRAPVVPSPIDEPADAAGDVRWDSTLAVALPVSTTQGPNSVTATRVSGFGPSRLGAAIAAAHLLARTSPRVGPAVFTPTLDEQVRGPNRQALADAALTAYQREASSLSLVAGEPLPGADAEIVGYRIVHHSVSDAAVEVVLSSTPLRVDGQLVVVRVALQRSGGDWVLVAPPRGDWGVVTTVLTATPADVLPYDGTA